MKGKLWQTISAEKEKGKRVLFLRRGVVAAVATALAVVGIFCAVLFPAYTAVSSTQRQLPIYSVETTGKRCAISFDAAWGNEDTQHSWAFWGFDIMNAIQ